jgi:hypothetical protein
MIPNYMLKNPVIFFLIVFILPFNLYGEYYQDNDPDPWCNTLSYDGGGYWTIRVPIYVKNKSGFPLNGDQFQIVVSAENGTSALIGELVASLRVSHANGVEYLFELENSDNVRKRDGMLSAGDVITFPVETGIDSIATVYLYSGNRLAWLPPDIRDFANDTSYKERIVNEWLEVETVKQVIEKHIEIQAGSPQFRELTVQDDKLSWISGISWEYRIPVIIRNFGERKIVAGTTTINTRHIHNRLGKIYGYNSEFTLCLIDPLFPDIPLDLAGSLEEGFRTNVDVEGLTEKTFWLYVSKDPAVPQKSRMINLYTGIRDHPDLDARVGEPVARRKQEWPLVAWSVNPLIKVFRQDLLPKQPVNNVRVFAVRNASKSFQIALRSLIDLDIKIHITPLKNTAEEEIPRPKIYKTGYVPVDFPVRYFRTPRFAPFIRFHPDRAGTDGWQDHWPDPLVPIQNDSPCNLNAGQTQPIWFDLHIPSGTSPGMYHGHVVLESANQKIYMPVEVKVWEIVLPDQRHITAIYDLRSGPGKDPFRGNGPDEKGWARFLSKYNVSPGLLSGADIQFNYENGQVQMETENFDEVVHFLINELNNSMLYTPGFFYSVGWYSGAKPIFGLEPHSPEYIRAWKEAYGLFINHITNKGWRDNFVLYLSDEPRIPRAYEAIARVADMAKEVAPDVPIYVSSWDYIEEIADHITAWGIGAQGQFPVHILEKRKKAGDRFIYTTDGQQSLDTPFPATERLMPWFCFKYGVEAFEFWGSTWWTFNPWSYGWHAFVKEGGSEEVRNPVRYPNGDGYLVYPGDELGLSDPVPSIRLIAVREGVDDFEIFHALEKHAEAGNEDAREVLDRVRDLVIQPHPAGTRSISFMPDPDAVEHVRNLAGEILDSVSEE